MVSPSSESAPGRHPRVVAGLPRDAPPDAPQVSALRSALVDGEYVAIPGMVLLELLRRFILPRAGSHRDRYGSS